MTDERYNFVPREYWPRLGPAFQGIDADLSALDATGAQVTPASLQPSLGLSAGTGTQTSTAYALGGVTGSWNDYTDTSPYCVGTRWTAGAAGEVASIRFWLTTGQYVGKTVKVGLYDDGGTLLGQGAKTITSGDGVGWVEVPLASPVNVNNGAAYRAALFAPVGNDGSCHQAKRDWGWDSYTSTGYVQSSKTGGNGWFGVGVSDLAFPNYAENTYFNMYGVDPVLTVTQTATNNGARLPVVAYYDDSNAATTPRPTSDPLACVLWFNVSGTALPANAVPDVDKVWTA